MPNLGLVVADTVLPSSVRAAVALAVDVRGWADRSELCVVAASVVVLVEDTDEADSDWCDCNARRLEGGPLVITMGRGTAVVDEAELDAVDVVVRTVGLVFLRFLFLNDICPPCGDRSRKVLLPFLERLDLRRALELGKGLRWTVGGLVVLFVLQSSSV
jgi:hypothetical protein